MSNNSVPHGTILHPPGFRKIEVFNRTWNGIDIRYVEKYPALGQSWADMRSHSPSVLVRLAQRGGVCEPRFRPDRPILRSRSDPGFFNWIPAGEQVWCFSDGAHFLRDLQLSFTPENLLTIIGDEFDLSKLCEPRLMVYDHRVLTCSRMMADLCVEATAQDQLYGESMTVALVAALVAAVTRAKEPASTITLAPWQLRMAKDYLQQNFARDISLDELANLTNLSKSHFARAFRGSTGLAPYRWVLQLRVERAKALLRKRNTPIAVVAAHVGFADQSHLTKTFRRFTGTTPRRWREEVSGDPSRPTPTDHGRHEDSQIG
jgi:AraC-like DNA-binding protein